MSVADSVGQNVLMPIRAGRHGKRLPGAIDRDYQSEADVG